MVVIFDLLCAGHIIENVILGDYVKDKVPSLQHFLSKGNKEQEYSIPSLAALSSAMRLLQRCLCEQNLNFLTYSANSKSCFIVH